MTDQAGSRRHPSRAGSRGGYFKAVETPPDGYVPGQFVSYRTLDPVRAAALTAAVEHCHGYDYLGSSTNVIKIAKEFEAYLTGEEANAT